MPITVDLKDLSKIVDNMESVKTKALNAIGDFMISEADRKLKARPGYNGKGKLVASLKKHFTRDAVEVISELLYADIQNTGGRVKITPKMRSFFWASYYRTKNVKWKHLAITTKTYVTIPKMPYLEITDLVKQFAYKELESEFNKIVR